MGLQGAVFLQLVAPDIGRKLAIVDLQTAMPRATVINGVDGSAGRAVEVNAPFRSPDR